MEEIAKLVTLTVSHTVEGLAAVMIGLAMLQVLFSYIRQWGRPRGMLAKEQLRLQFGSSVAVALELLLGADVLSTAVAPSWNDIGKLAAHCRNQNGPELFS